MKELLRARELGDTSDLSKALLAQIPETGEVTPLSEKPEVDAILQAGEAAFAKGDWEQARAAYSKAWDLDHSARAALYLGDTYFGMKDMGRAGEWFAKSIEANPNIETAYRYWGDALMAQGKTKEARAKYIDGVVADRSHGGQERQYDHQRGYVDARQAGCRGNLAGVFLGEIYRGMSV